MIDTISDFHTYIFGNKDADMVLLQMVDDHDMDLIDREIAHIRELCPGKDFCLQAVKVNYWNHDLSPWPAPAVFGKKDFAGKAEETLHIIIDEIIPCIIREDKMPKQKLIIGGYSLAGLFALWLAYQTDCFDGIAAASPSIWYPDFTDYMSENTFRAQTVYLSLGDKEERTRNPVMARVGGAIRQGQIILKDAGVDCILEWNKGNHFKDPDLRTARAFAWVMSRLYTT
ncbi:MAG: esterase [Eubacterium sp.]|nr:esterase [Eubacterium sp.]